jgi:hypothetical protein
MSDMEAVKARYPFAWQSGTGHIWASRMWAKSRFLMKESIGSSWEDARARLESNPVEAEER